MNALLRYENITLMAGTTPLLQDISGTVAAGRRLLITGPSGSGKSTLLKLTNRLLSPISGRIVFDGRPLDAGPPSTLRRQVGYVPQTPLLFASSAAENLTYAYSLHGRTPDHSEIRYYLDALSLPPALLDKPLPALSGGEKQRLCLIRSLLVKPAVLLLDEPTAALDAAAAAAVETLLCREQQQRGLTLLWVTHSEEQARRLATDRLHIIAGRTAHWGEGTRLPEVLHD